MVVEIESKSSHMLGQVSVAKLFNSRDQAEAAGYRVGLKGFLFFFCFLLGRDMCMKIIPLFFHPKAE